MPIMPRSNPVLADDREIIGYVPYIHDKTERYPVRFPPRYNFYDQVFSFTPAGEKTLHIHVGKVWRMVEARRSDFQPITVSITLAQAQFVAQNHGVEVGHLSRVSSQTLDTPGLLLDFGETQTIMDGNHRYILRFLGKLETMDFILVTIADIQDCLLDLPQDFGLDPGHHGWGDLKEMKGSSLGPDGKFTRAKGKK